MGGGPCAETDYPAVINKLKPRGFRGEFFWISRWIHLYSLVIFFLLSVIFIGFLGDIFLIFRWFFFISWISRCFFWISRRGPGSRLGVLVQWSRVGFLVGLGVRNKSRLLVFYKYINNICFREGVKKTFFLGDLSQMCLPTHPSQGFCEIWEHKRWIFVRPEFVIFIWETVSPPTHVWEKSPIFYAFPNPP